MADVDNTEHARRVLLRAKAERLSIAATLPGAEALGLRPRELAGSTKERRRLTRIKQEVTDELAAETAADGG